MARTVCWFSAGAASAVATRLVLRQQPDAVISYCETGAEHPDNERFIADCVRWFNRPVERLRSERYESTWDVWERRRYLAGIDGALCTTELKVMPRPAVWQVSPLFCGIDVNGLVCQIIRHIPYPSSSFSVSWLLRSGRHSKIVASRTSRAAHVAHLGQPPCVLLHRSP